jgi:hypothetical protein
VAMGGRGSTVAHVNSLRGACLVQGVLAAVTLRERWPSILITESHPKALLQIDPDARPFASLYEFSTEHERDAAVGAFAAMAYDRRLDGWSDWISFERAPFVPSGGGCSVLISRCCWHSSDGAIVNEVGSRASRRG